MDGQSALSWLPDALVNITSIIRLSGNSQENGPVEIPRGVLLGIRGTLALPQSISGFPVQFFECRLRDAALDGSMRRVAFQLDGRVVNGDEEGEGLVGRRPRSANGMATSRISAAATRGVACRAAPRAVWRPSGAARRSGPVRAHDHQPAVGRGREADAASKTLRQLSARPAHPGRDGDRGARGRTRTGGSEPPARDAVGHRPGWHIGLDDARRQPFEVAGRSPVQDRAEEADRRHDRDRHMARADVGGEELLWDRLPEHVVHVSEVAPEELVELEVVVGRVVVAVPPAPVAALGDQQLFESLLPVRALAAAEARPYICRASRSCRQARRSSRVADPDEEVAVDP